MPAIGDVQSSPMGNLTWNGTQWVTQPAPSTAAPMSNLAQLQSAPVTGSVPVPSQYSQPSAPPPAAMTGGPSFATGSYLPSTGTPLSSSWINVVMPNGQTQLFSQSTPMLTQALAAGGQAYSYSSGSPIPAAGVNSYFASNGAPGPGGPVITDGYNPAAVTNPFGAAASYVNGAAGTPQSNVATSIYGDAAPSPQGNPAGLQPAAPGAPATQNNAISADDSNDPLGGGGPGTNSAPAPAAPAAPVAPGPQTNSSAFATPNQTLGSNPANQDQAPGNILTSNQVDINGNPILTNTTTGSPSITPTLGGSPVDPTTGLPTTGMVDPTTGLPTTGTSTDPSSVYASLGLGNSPTSPQVNLGTMPLMSGSYSPQFQSEYAGNVAAQTQNVGNYYQQTPNATAATMDLSQVPQTTATPAAQSQALQFLLSGQGYDPATLAQMHANATDSVANQGISALASANLAAQRAGLGNSGVSVALQQQQAQQNAANQVTANNAIDVQNAQQGMTNLTAGAGLQNTLATDNSQQANLVALQNASSMLQAMNTNVANAQQTNMTNYAGNLSTNQAKAGAQATTEANADQAYNTSALNQSTEANAGNAAAAQNWDITQGGLTAQNNQFNVSQTNANNQNAMGNLTSLTNGAGGVPGAAAAGSLFPNINYNNPYSNLAATAATQVLKPTTP